MRLRTLLGKRIAVANMHILPDEYFERFIRLVKSASKNPQETENNLRDWIGYHILHSDGSLKKGYNPHLHCIEATVDFGAGYIYISGTEPFRIEEEKPKKRIELQIERPIYTLQGLYSKRNAFPEDSKKIKALEEELSYWSRREADRIREKSVSHREKLKRLILENRYKRKVLI